MNIRSSQLKQGRFNLKLILFSRLLLLQAGFTTAQNVATNPGNETGNTTDWFGFGTPTLTLIRQDLPQDLKTMNIQIKRAKDE
jgi:hypothetical protein